eukprot:8155519-Pyramimonas_sp.AAC.1
MAQVTQNFWLSYWSEHRLEHPQSWFLHIYVFIGVVQLLVLFTRNVTYITAGVKGANRMHGDLLNAVMRAPMSFFHTTPAGRILNRFSLDTYTLDEKVADTLSSYLSQVRATLGIVSYARRIAVTFQVVLKARLATTNV